jgi:CRP/FNR family transcriptional regulator, cyclic AMP receptor protein
VQEDRRALWYLKKVPLFDDLGTDELSELANVVTLMEVRRKRVIFMHGDPAASAYFVNGGRVKISRVTRDGKELTLAYRGPGELFGELCLVGGIRVEMAEAIDDALVTEVPRDAFIKLLDTHVSIGAKLSRILCEWRLALESKLEDLVFKDVGSKLAELLLGLSQDYGVDDRRGTLLAVKITHQEMANLIGSTRETVSLTLSEFKRSGLISTDGRKIIITDRDGLQALL